MEDRRPKEARALTRAYVANRLGPLLCRLAYEQLVPQAAARTKPLAIPRSGSRSLCNLAKGA